MSSQALWVRFADESFPVEAIDGDALRRLESLWRAALAETGFIVSLEHRFFTCLHKVPYLNFSLLASVLSDGSMRVVRGEDGGFRIQSATSWMRSTLSLVKIHWKLERQLSVSIERIDSVQIRSLALGLCQQLLLMRLPRHTPKMLATWFMDPEHAPVGTRRTLRQLVQLQKRRQDLSGAWHGFFQSGFDSSGSADGLQAPELVWSDGVCSELIQPSIPSTISNPSPPKTWTGLGVFPGSREGIFWVVPELLEGDAVPPENTSIFIFSRARPSTVEFFHRAAAILFAEGGMLSHACCLAREQHIPCVTGLGKEFLSAARASPEKQIQIEVQANNGVGTVTIF